MDKVVNRNRIEPDSAEMIRFRTLKRIENIGSDHAKIELRLKQLDAEWSIERVLQTKAAFVTIWGTMMGLRRKNRAWFALPLIASGLLLQHALMEKSPDFKLIRKWGFRTRHEIDDERTLLKGLRGDFSRINELSASDVMETVRS
ncbi:MAG TPA: hypothetical protein PL182_10640 [Pseudobdellovibrionaceae bacterium]|nr:hypothetical protein [Pseudobdellovibrionaceae bacterium]